MYKIVSKNKCNAVCNYTITYILSVTYNADDCAL